MNDSGEPKVDTSRRHPRRIALGLLALGLLLAILGTLGVYFTTFPGVTIKRVSFSTAHYESPPRKVSALLILPDRPAAKPTPAVVFCHGVLMSKEAYLAQDRELARNGLVVLAIDMRGHGDTGGANDMGLSERKDVWAAADYLSEAPGVDPDRIAAMGHSLGGTAVTTAGTSQKGDLIKAVVAIGCQSGRKQALLYSTGRIGDFIGRIWPFAAWSRRFDVNSSRDLEERDVISRIDGHRPPNFLIVLGDRDSVEPVSEAEAIMRKATGRLYVAPGRTYGSFKDGTARRLDVTNDTHLSEGYSSAAWTASARWLFESFGLDPAGVTVRQTAMTRYASQAAIMIGFFLAGLALLVFLSSLRKTRPKAVDVAPYRPDGRRPAVALAVTSSVLFAGISIASFPFARLTGMRAFVPYLGADIYTSLVASRTILLIPATAILFALTKAARWNDLRPASPLTAGRRGNLGWSALLGVSPFVVFVALYAPAAWALLMTRGVPNSAAGFLTLAGVLVIQLWAEQEYFHYFLLPSFRPGGTFWKRASYVLLESGVRGVSLGLAFITVVASPSYSLTRMHFPLVLVLMVVGFLVVLPVSALSYYARRHGYSVLAPCLGVALFAALIFGSLLSVRAF
jgi:dienelactone hydrolase